MSRLKGMQVDDFIIWIYYWVDDVLPCVIGDSPIRKRCFFPALFDAKLITIEIVGEFLGFDANKQIWSYFSSYWKHLFPNNKPLKPVYKAGCQLVGSKAKTFRACSKKVTQ